MTDIDSSILHKSSELSETSDQFGDNIYDLELEQSTYSIQTLNNLEKYLVLHAQDEGPSIAEQLKDLTDNERKNLRMGLVKNKLSAEDDRLFSTLSLDELAALLLLSNQIDYPELMSSLSSKFSEMIKSTPPDQMAEKFNINCETTLPSLKERC